MGVMQCNRKGCKNIMCDRYSKTHGYICNDCFIELCEKLIPIFSFMKSDKSLNEKSKTYKNSYIDGLKKEFPMKKKEQL